MKPKHILGFYFLTLLSIVIISLLFPKNGINLFDKHKLSFYNLKDIFKSEVMSKSDSILAKKDTIAKSKELAELEKKSELLHLTKEQILKKTSKSVIDTLLLLKVEASESDARFYYQENEYSEMERFFDLLEKMKADNTALRIIHYGDSQIEMDRISSQLRENLQNKYGGFGPGLQPALEVTPKYTVGVEGNEKWDRILTFGINTIKSKHNRYGPMAYYCLSKNDNSTIYLSARKNSSYKNRNFNECKVVLGAHSNNLYLKLTSAGKLLHNDTILANETEKVHKYSLDTSNGQIYIQINGGKSEVLGIGLDGKKGISLDNVPMRGSNGLVFKKINYNTLQNTYKQLGVKVLILQYGGNAMPGMTLKSSAEHYGNKFYEELKYLKSVDPELVIFVIGPADMAESKNGVLQTHNQMENMVEAMKNACIKANCIFWDTYRAMGGKNSIIEWTKLKPALASPDYIHFTQAGANKIANLFYNTLQKEYHYYQTKSKLNVD